MSAKLGCDKTVLLLDKMIEMDKTTLKTSKEMLDDIKERVANFFEITVDELEGTGTVKKIGEAKTTAYALIRRFVKDGLTAEQIANAMGSVNKNSYYHATKQMDNYLSLHKKRSDLTPNNIIVAYKKISEEIELENL